VGRMPPKKSRRRDSIDGAGSDPRVTKRQRTHEPEPIFGVTLSPDDKAPQVVLSGRRLTATNEKGYRAVRATHSVSDGRWCFEAQVQQPAPSRVQDMAASQYSAHTRLGWCTEKAELQAPVGFDAFGFSYRDIGDRAHPSSIPSPPLPDGTAAPQGSVFHMSRGRLFGEPYGPGDVITCYIALPSTEIDEGEPVSVKQTAEDPEHPAGPRVNLAAYNKAAGAEADIHTGSYIAFAKNGHYLGQAFQGLPAGNYFPSVALYMGASVTLNFGPKFAFPQPEECKGFLPMSNLAPAALLPPAPLFEEQEGVPSEGSPISGAALVKQEVLKEEVEPSGELKAEPYTER